MYWLVIGCCGLYWLFYWLGIGKGWLLCGFIYGNLYLFGCSDFGVVFVGLCSLVWFG